MWSWLCGFILQMINDVLPLLLQFHQQFSTRQHNVRVQIELKSSMDDYCFWVVVFSTIYSYQIFWCVYCSSRENWIGDWILLFFCKRLFWNFSFLFFLILLSLSQHHGLSVISVWRTSVPLDGEPEVRRQLQPPQGSDWEARSVMCQLPEDRPADGFPQWVLCSS